MTKSLSTTFEQKCPVSLFWQHKEKQAAAKVPSPALVKDMLTPYFSIPTASRVHSCFHHYKAHPRPTKGIERFFSFCFHGVSKTLKRFFYESPPYNTSDIVKPKELLVPQLPDPVFVMQEPQRLFFTLPESVAKDAYSPPCLMRETPYSPAQRISREKTLLSLVNNTFPLKGELRKDPTGMMYLFIGNNETHIHPLPKELLDPSETHLLPHPMGTHIPVIMPSEMMQARNLGIQNELGKEFSFSVTGCFSVDTPLHDHVEKAWFLEVESKELTQLREKYLLPSKVGSHSFHIVLSLKKRDRENSVKPTTFRLNVSCYAA